MQQNGGGALDPPVDPHGNKEGGWTTPGPTQKMRADKGGTYHNFRRNQVGLRSVPQSKHLIKEEKKEYQKKSLQEDNYRRSKKKLGAVLTRGWG